MKDTKLTEKQLDKAFRFLDELRESGDVNMWGARPYLQMEFPAWSEKKCKDALFSWMKSSPVLGLELRVRLAIIWIKENRP